MPQLPSPPSPPSPPATPPELVRAFRQRFAVTQPALAVLLDLEPGALAEYEQGGGPGWLRYALAGLARSVFDAPDAEARAFVG